MINQLTITNFRNHSCSRVSVGDYKNIIITGQNGSGKTAILEAISILSGEHGLRNADSSEIAKFNGDGSFSVFVKTKEDNDICVYYDQKDTNKHIKINNENSTFAEIAKILKIIWITPKEDRLFVDSASNRRNFFDRLTSCFDPSHIGRITRITKLLSERAAALKSSFDPKWLDAIDKQIASTAISIGAARIKYAGEINYIFKTGAISVDGMIEKLLIENTNIDAENKYFEYLKNNRFLTGDKMVIDGVHKSDFGVFNNTLKLPVHITSTGQQKSLLIDLILAHTKLINLKTNKKTIILLDEATAHLDEQSKKRLFEELNNSETQVWATGLEPDLFKNIPNTIFVTCQNGTISNIVTSE
ncbi:MAG: AAA family ATPase [Alphaproteobacteria bacterium]|nr:AAA family ATPase [Alphaproteobacteria bacterium]